MYRTVVVMVELNCSGWKTKSSRTILLALQMCAPHSRLTMCECAIQPRKTRDCKHCIESLPFDPQHSIYYSPFTHLLLHLSLFLLAWFSSSRHPAIHAPSYSHSPTKCYDILLLRLRRLRHHVHRHCRIRVNVK